MVAYIITGARRPDGPLNMDFVIKNIIDTELNTYNICTEFLNIYINVFWNRIIFLLKLMMLSYISW